MSSHETLGLLLVRDGVMTRPQLYDALRLQRQNGRLLGTCLLELGYMGQEQLLEMLSRQLAIPALPPGALSGYAPEAVARVPGELAVRLGIVPYSWDGELLGVAVADGRALGYLHQVSFYSQSAVGAYVALEIEIEAVLRALYPRLTAVAGAAGQPASTEPLGGRPRPARVAPLREIPTRDFDRALGLDAGLVTLTASPPAGHARALILGAPPPAPAARATSGAPVSFGRRRDPPRPAGPVEVERIGFYDAVDRIYAAGSAEEVGRSMAGALLSYFSRVLVLALSEDALRLIGFGGARPTAAAAGIACVPGVAAELDHRTIAYGPAEDDPRAAELTAAFGLEPPATALIAPIAGGGARLLAYADNAGAAELYEELHDVEMLFKETETALGLLASGC